jgi:rhodanese-related sulfurtransferase
MIATIVTGINKEGRDIKLSSLLNQGGINMSRTITPQALKERIDKEKNILVLDVRRNADYEADEEIIPGAIRRNPEQIDQWAQELPKDKDVVVYCIRGGSVSNSVVDKLLAVGVSVSYIEGGWEAWKKLAQT